MNILVFSWRDPKHPLAGGAEQVMHEHMKGWIRAGHHVTLLASRFKGSVREEVLDEVKIIRAGNQYLGVQFEAFNYYRKNKDRYDLIVDQFHGLPFFTPLFVDKPKLAVIQETAREVWFLNPFPWPLSWLIGVLGYFGEPLIFLIYKNIQFMTGSESAKKDVAGLGVPVKNITVIPHGVIVIKPANSVRKEKRFTITFLGIITKDKGIEDALRCFALLAKQKEIQFWIIGRFETEEYRKRILALIKSMGLDNKIKFWGFVDIKKKFELLRKSHLLVNPSIREGWGLVNIEANSMSTPVIAYSSQGLVDSVKNGKSGVLCKKNTPEEMARVIKLIFDDSLLFEKLQKGAVEWSSKFSWKYSSKQSLLLIKKLLIEQKKHSTRYYSSCL